MSYINDFNHDLSKRYYLFAYASFYPLGGLNDLVCTIDDLNDLRDELDRCCQRIRNGYCHILDMHLRKVVYTSFMEQGNLLDEKWSI